MQVKTFDRFRILHECSCFIEFMKRGKRRGMDLSLLRNAFNEFISTGARILDSIYHMTLRLH